MGSCHGGDGLMGWHDLTGLDLTWLLVRLRPLFYHCSQAPSIPLADLFAQLIFYPICFFHVPRLG
jgi:hypothetical protein